MESRRRLRHAGAARDQGIAAGLQGIVQQSLAVIVGAVAVFLIIDLLVQLQPSLLALERQALDSLHDYALAAFFAHLEMAPDALSRAARARSRHRENVSRLRIRPVQPMATVR